MGKEIISTINAPSAIGPYSQAVRAGDLIFTSGQLPMDPNSGELIRHDIKMAATQCFENIRAILDEVNVKLDQVIKVTVYLRDMDDFDEMNMVYSNYFAVKQPARSCIEVSKLPKNAPILIEVVALAN